ncbi:MAG: COX15/CtaA family protein [Aliivibrio sp.]|uniref:COX15/CtaA family protein n=1 Tax=Aliivibrio sp. TaxID=1872443 RepID=UPI001A3CD363|nr:COX15/CtaA family protein [Aliivibrio sp.]
MKLPLLLKLSLVLATLVILMGAYTRLSDAGLGCPDWPGCYGSLTVPSEHNSAAQSAFPERKIEPKKAWLEMIHRYIAGGLGGLVALLLGVSIWNNRASSGVPRTPQKLPFLIAVLIIFQALLGMWTVTMKLMPVVVVSHLMGGYSLISLLLILYLRLTTQREILKHQALLSLSPLALLGMGVLLLQIMLGGWTSSNYAAMACSQLPICEGEWADNVNFKQAFTLFQGEHSSYEFGVLDYYSRMTIHVTHRIGAMVTAAVLLWLAVKLINQSQSTRLRGCGIALIGLIILQVGLGISNVVLHLPLGIAVSHNGGALLLLLMMVFINFHLYGTNREKKRDL